MAKTRKSRRDQVRDQKLEEYTGKANTFRELVVKRTGIQAADLECPREKSSMTPCVGRDGGLAVASGAFYVCVGCGVSVDQLLDAEKKKHEQPAAPGD